MPDYSGRDWKERTFTVGIGGPVGSGKTALLLALCRALRDDYNIGECSHLLMSPSLPSSLLPFSLRSGEVVACVLLSKGACGVLGTRRAGQPAETPGWVARQ